MNDKTDKIFACRASINANDEGRIPTFGDVLEQPEKISSPTQFPTKY